MMYKTIYRISKMDCPSEEQMIRMKLDGIDNIQDLDKMTPEKRASKVEETSYI